MANELFPDLPLTSFPQNIDSFTTWLNVTAQDGPLIQQYITAMNAGNQTQANQILSQNFFWVTKNYQGNRPEQINTSNSRRGEVL